MLTVGPSYVATAVCERAATAPEHTLSLTCTAEAEVVPAPTDTEESR